MGEHKLMKTLLSILVAIFFMGLSQLVSAQDSLLVKVHYQGEQYQVVNVKRIGLKLKHSSAKKTRNSDILFRLSNNKNKTLTDGRISNPATFRALLSQESDDQQSHAIQSVEEGFFMLRLPYTLDTQFLHLTKQNSSRQSRSLGTSTQVEQTIDLSAFL